jgi:hypothetical protein
MEEGTLAVMARRLRVLTASPGYEREPLALMAEHLLR